MKSIYENAAKGVLQTEKLLSEELEKYNLLLTIDVMRNLPWQISQTAKKY